MYLMRCAWVDKNKNPQSPPTCILNKGIVSADLISPYLNIYLYYDLTKL